MKGEKAEEEFFLNIHALHVLHGFNSFPLGPGCPRARG